MVTASFSSTIPCHDIAAASFSSLPSLHVRIPSQNTMFFSMCNGIQHHFIFTCSENNNNLLWIPECYQSTKWKEVVHWVQCICWKSLLASYSLVQDHFRKCCKNKEGLWKHRCLIKGLFFYYNIWILINKTHWGKHFWMNPTKYVICFGNSSTL